MGENASTLYLATEDGEAIGTALCAVLAEEGYATERGRTQIGWWRRGEPGWTVLETFPPELLLERPLGSREPRVALLARRLACDVVYLAIHDGKDVLLVEADARGRWAATGAGDLSQRDPERLDKDDPRAGRDGTVPRFVILDATEPMREAIAKKTGAIRALARLLAGKKAPLPVHEDHDADGTKIVYSMSRNAGARVRHARFGEGSILDELAGDPPKLDIQFDDGKRATLLARFVERI